MFSLFCFSINAQISFQKNYGNSSYQFGYAVKQCYDGGYIITGGNWTPQYNAYLIRTDALGDTLWTRTYGGDNMLGFDVIQTSDSNFVISGYHNVSGGLLLKKVDANGNTLWTRTGTGGWGQAVQQTFDGGFIVGGRNLNKTDSNGLILWTKTPPGGGQAMYVIQAADSNYVATGFAGNYIYLKKIDTAGTTIWTKSYTGTLQNTSNNDLAQTSDGGYILAGQDTGSAAGALLIKTDANGDTLWRKFLPADYGTGVVQTKDGGYAVSGSSLNQMILIKTDANGIVQWSNTYGAGVVEWAKSVHQTVDGGYVLTGMTTINNGDVFLVKTDCMGNETFWDSINCPLNLGIGNMETSEFPELQIYPNPFNSSATIRFNSTISKGELNIFDVLGRQVKQLNLPAGQAGNIFGQSITLHRGNLPGGLYFIRLTQDNKIYAAEKLVITD